MSDSKCELCGEPMPKGEQMFKYHGYSGSCPKPPLPKPANQRFGHECTQSCFEVWPLPWGNSHDLFWAHTIVRKTFDPGDENYARALRVVLDTLAQVRLSIEAQARDRTNNE